MPRTRPQKHLPRPLVHLVRAELPTARPYGARVVGVGFDVIAWRVADPTGDWTLRIPRHDGALDVIRAQTVLMHSLADLIPVPRDARLVSRDGEDLCGAYRYVEGRQAHPRNDEESERLAAALGGILSRLHVHPVGNLVGARNVHPVRDRFGPIIERCLPHLGAAHHAWVTGANARLARLASTIPESVLVHADLKPEHVLLDEAGDVLALLDFEGIQTSDPAIDFSRIIQHWGRPFGERVFAAYTLPADELLMERAQIYCGLDALELLDTALHDPSPEWTEVALRMVDELVARESPPPAR